MPTLAINGGDPIRTKPFSAWPVLDTADIRRLKAFIIADDGELAVQKSPNLQSNLPNSKVQTMVCALIAAQPRSISP